MVSQFCFLYSPSIRHVSIFTQLLLLLSISPSQQLPLDCYGECLYVITQYSRSPWLFYYIYVLRSRSVCAVHWNVHRLNSTSILLLAQTTPFIRVMWAIFFCYVNCVTPILLTHSLAPVCVWVCRLYYICYGGPYTQIHTFIFRNRYYNFARSKMNSILHLIYAFHQQTSHVKSI